MNHEELAFVNQQLAGMLKCGLPLEGSLKQLCATMRRGRLRAELEALEADLAQGTPLKDALARRKLPDFYQHMLVVGAQANDLPGVLTMLADHYSRTHLLTTRLKGLAVYPALVLACAFVLSAALAWMLGEFILSNDAVGLFGEIGSSGGMPWHLKPHFMLANVWAPPIALFSLVTIFCLALSVARFRHALAWRLPGFREANLSQTASSLALLLKGGVPLADSLEVVRRITSDRRAAEDIAAWKTKVESGNARLSELSSTMKRFPPLFFWLTAGAGEDLSEGLQRTSDLYGSRAQFRYDLFLYAALPLMIGLLGVMIVSQLAACVRIMQTLYVAM